MAYGNYLVKVNIQVFLSPSNLASCLIEFYLHYLNEITQHSVLHRLSFGDFCLLLITAFKTIPLLKTCLLTPKNQSESDLTITSKLPNNCWVYNHLIKNVTKYLMPSFLYFSFFFTSAYTFTQIPNNQLNSSFKMAMHMLNIKHYILITMGQSLRCNPFIEDRAETVFLGITNSLQSLFSHALLQLSKTMSHLNWTAVVTQHDITLGAVINSDLCKLSPQLI